MEYRDRTEPKRDVHFTDFKLVGNDQVSMTMRYHTESEKRFTWVRQPVTISLCEIRRLGGEFHKLLDTLEDRLREARQHMKGTRQ